MRFVGAGIGASSPFLSGILESIRSELIKGSRERGIERLELPSLAPSDLFPPSPRLRPFQQEMVRTSVSEMILTPCVEEWATLLWLEGGPRRHVQTHFFDISRRFRDGHAKRGISRMREFETFDVIGVVHSETEAYESLRLFRELLVGLVSLFGIEMHEIIRSKYNVLFQFRCQEGEHRICLTEGQPPRELLGEERCPSGSEEMVTAGLAFADRVAVECMQDTVANRFGGPKAPLVLTYTVGIMRVAHAYLESSRDSGGFALRQGLRPWDAGIVVASPRFPDLAAATEFLYGGLQERGISPLLDDRPRASVADKLAMCWFLGCESCVLTHFSDGLVAFEVLRRDGSSVTVSSVARALEVLWNFSH